MTALMGTTTFLRRYLNAHDPLDAATIEACRHPDFEGYPPQSAAAGLALRDVIWQLTGRDDVWIAQGVGTAVNRQPCHVVIVMQLRAGLVHRQTTWFAPSFPRPESRAGLSELAEWQPADDVVEVGVSTDVLVTRQRAIAAYFADVTHDPAAAHERFLHPDSVEIMPQSSESIHGRDRMLEVLRSHPTFPTVALQRTLVVGNTGLAEVLMTEGGEDFFGIGIVRFRAAKAASITEYWVPRLGGDGEG